MNVLTKKLIFLFCCLIILTIYLQIRDKNELFYEHFEMSDEIPKIIYLTSKTKDIPGFVIPNWKKIYPNYQIKLYDNNDCINFLGKEYGVEHIDIFNHIKDGPIKADFWRVCILYKYGGIYSDIDSEPLVNMEKILEKNTTFMTSTSNTISNFNPQFIVSKANHIILKKCIDKYIEMYRKNKEYTYWGWSIVNVMKDVFKEHLGYNLTKDGIYLDKENNKYQMLNEIVPNNNIKNAYCEYKGVKVLNIRYSLYDSDNHTWLQ